MDESSKNEPAERLYKVITESVEAMFAHPDLEPDFDPAPLFYIGVGSKLMVIDPMHEFDLDRHAAAEAFRVVLRGIRQDLEPGTALVAGFLCAGWKLDPLTRARIGETVLVTVETPDAECLLAYYTVTRHEGAPPTLVLDHKVVNEKPNPGMMSNFFYREVMHIDLEQERDS